MLEIGCGAATRTEQIALHTDVKAIVAAEIDAIRTLYPNLLLHVELRVTRLREEPSDDAMQWAAARREEFEMREASLSQDVIRFNATISVGAKLGDQPDCFVP